MLLARRGKVEEGEALARDALERALASGYYESKVEAYLSLGEVLRLDGRPEEAREAYESALAILERKGFELSADAARAKLAELQSSGSPAEMTRASGVPADEGAKAEGRRTVHE